MRGAVPHALLVDLRLVDVVRPEVMQAFDFLIRFVVGRRIDCRGGLMNGFRASGSIAFRMNQSGHSLLMAAAAGSAKAPLRAPTTPRSVIQIGATVHINLLHKTACCGVDGLVFASDVFHGQMLRRDGA